eukprot:UN34588
MRLRGDYLKKLVAKLSGGITKVVHSEGAFAALKDTGEVVSWGWTSYGGYWPNLDEILTNVKDIFKCDNAFAAVKALKKKTKVKMKTGMWSSGVETSHIQNRLHLL